MFRSNYRKFKRLKQECVEFQIHALSKSSESLWSDIEAMGLERILNWQVKLFFLDFLVNCILDVDMPLSVLGSAKICRYCSFVFCLSRLFIYFFTSSRVRQLLSLKSYRMTTQNILILFNQFRLQYMK